MFKRLGDLIFYAADPGSKPEEEVVEEVVEEKETSLKEEADDFRNRTIPEEDLKAIADGDKQAQEDIADLLSLNDDEKKAGEIEEKEVEDKGEEEEVKEEKKEEVKEEEKEVEEEIDPLMAELGRLTAQLMGGEKPSAGEKKEEVVEQKAEPDNKLVEALATPVDTTEQTYIQPTMFKDSFDDTDRKQLNTIINQVVTKVREDTRNQTLQDAMKIFPQMMDYKVKGYLAAQEFWANNPDLKGFCEKYPQIKQYVQYRSSEIQRQHPDYTLGDVFRDTEKEVRSLLKDRLTTLKPEADPNKSNGAGKPGLVRKPGASRKAPPANTRKVTTEQEEILELISFK